MIEEELHLLRSLRERIGPDHEQKSRSKKKIEKESLKEEKDFGQEKDLEVSVKEFVKNLDQLDIIEQDILAEPIIPVGDKGQPEMTSSCESENIWKEEPELDQDQTKPLSEDSNGACGLSEPIDDLLTSSNESVCSAKDEK